MEARNLGLYLDQNDLDLVVRAADPLNQEAQQRLNAMARENALKAAAIFMLSQEVRQGEGGPALAEDAIKRVFKVLDFLSNRHLSEEQERRVFERNGFDLVAYENVRSFVRENREENVRVGEEGSSGFGTVLSHILSLERLKNNIRTAVPSRRAEEERSNRALGEAIAEEATRAVRGALEEAERREREQERMAREQVERAKEQLRGTFGTYSAARELEFAVERRSPEEVAGQPSQKKKREEEV